MPFTLVKVTLRGNDGKEIENKPMWLMAQGKRRAELSPRQIFKSYRQRFDIEHFFRFGKQRLLMDKFQTADTEHEESGWQLVQLAYVQLYLAKEASQHLPYDWEKYLPENQDASHPVAKSRDARLPSFSGANRHTRRRTDNSWYPARSSTRRNSNTAS